MKPRRPRLRAFAWASCLTIALAILIVAGSRNLAHFDAALVGYTFATLFATFGITWRYSMWLERPPTRMYWRRGWKVIFAPRALLPRMLTLVRRAVVDLGANRFILRRGRLRGLTHLAIMWGCLLASAITFPLVWGWIHFETAASDLGRYRTFLFGFPVGEMAIDSVLAFLVFHGLVWASVLVLGGIMLAFRRRMVERGPASVQQFGEDVLPLVLLGAICVTGLMLSVSYTWMHGYAYDFLAIIHAASVIITFLWLPFGKFFHIFQRPAQLGVRFYKDAAEDAPPARCKRCAAPYASRTMIEDLIDVERELGFRYELDGAAHYQEVCPPCRRALFGLAQGALWTAPALDMQKRK